jgi:hypothetical protein
MKRIPAILIFCIAAVTCISQNTLMVENVGTSRKYFYHTGDYIKLRVSKQDTLLAGKLWSIRDSVISVSELRPFDVHISDIGSVYKRFAFPRKLGKKLIYGGVGIFAIIVANHLINNEQVFTPDLFIISGSAIAGGLISLSLSQKRCRTGRGWKIKVLDIVVN